MLASFMTEKSMRFLNTRYCGGEGGDDLDPGFIVFLNRSRLKKCGKEGRRVD